MALDGGEQLNELTERVIGHAYTVWNELGYGFLEKVYENALVIALADDAIKAEQQKALCVHFRDKLVGEYVVDLLVADEVLIELKAAKEIAEAHKAQLLNYLKATGIRTGLLLNFGPDGVQVKRFRK